MFLGQNVYLRVNVRQNLELAQFLCNLSHFHIKVSSIDSEKPTIFGLD